MFDDKETRHKDRGFFTIAAAFGNVHGVYQPGNVKLEPNILDKASSFVLEPKMDVVQGKVLGNEKKTTGEGCVWFFSSQEFPDFFFTRVSRFNRFIETRFFSRFVEKTTCWTVSRKEWLAYQPKDMIWWSTYFTHGWPCKTMLCKACAKS